MSEHPFIVRDGITTARIEALTGLRFFAAASIVLWHSQADYLFGMGAFNPFFPSSAVALFFVLSGYVLAVNASKYKSWPTFFLARIARIWPAHIAALLFWVILFYPGSLSIILGPNGYVSLSLNILMLQSWSTSMATFWSYNGVSWSISCEMFFYLMFPICLLLLRRRLIIGLSCMVIAGAAFLYGVGATVPTLDPLWLGYINPLINLPIFAFGIAIGIIRMRLPAAKAGPVLGTLLQIGAVALAIWGNYYMAAIDVRPAPPAVVLFMNGSGAAWCYAVLIFVLGRYPGTISTTLSHPVLVYLGEISYAIYLFHQPILHWHATHYRMFHVNVWVQYACLWVVVIGISSLVHHTVERPAQRWIKRAWQWAWRPSLVGAVMGTKVGIIASGAGRNQG